MADVDPTYGPHDHLVDPPLKIEWRLFPHTMVPIEWLAATPPMPREEWEQMVERAARAVFLLRNGSATCWAWDDGGLDDEHPGARERYLREAAAALRAALPGLVIEGEQEDSHG